MGTWRAAVMVTVAAMVAAVILAAASVDAQEVSRGILEVDTWGKVAVPRKSALVAVTISTKGLPPTHIQRAQQAFVAVKRILRDLSVPDKDIREKSVAVDKACCSSDSDRGVEYEYIINLDVVLPTIDAAVSLLGRIRGRAVEDVSVGNIRFPLINPEPLVRTAQQISIDSLERQASAMATAMDGRLGDIVALRSTDNKASLLNDDRYSWTTRRDRFLNVYTTGRIEMFHNFG